MMNNSIPSEDRSLNDIGASIEARVCNPSEFQRFMKRQIPAPPPESNRDFQTAPKNPKC
jgi:hypothetical protein